MLVDVKIGLAANGMGIGFIAAGEVVGVKTQLVEGAGGKVGALPGLAVDQYGAVLGDFVDHLAQVLQGDMKGAVDHAQG